MNPYVFVGLGALAAADYYGKGEIDDIVAFSALLLCSLAWQADYIWLLPLTLVALYIMRKSGCAYLDLVVFMVLSMTMGLAAFLGLFLALGGVIAVNWKKGLKEPVVAVFLPYLFVGCLAADLIFSAGQTWLMPPV